MSLAGFKASNHPQQTGKRGANDAVDDRGTDQAFFDSLSKRFGGFTLDVAAAPHNAKCERYFTRADNGLAQRWHECDSLAPCTPLRAERVWCNPPYSRTVGVSTLDMWVRKAWDEWLAYMSPDEVSIPDRRFMRRRGGPELIVMLVPANRTEQSWWQHWIEPYRDRPRSPLRVEFLPGRMRFDRPQAVIGPKGDRPPFGCCLLIWTTPST